MDSSPAPKPSDPPSSADRRPDHGPLFLTALMFLGVSWLLSPWSRSFSLAFLRNRLPANGNLEWASSPVPLAMVGGDPYIRALMRTISASESNTTEPYQLLYGGQQVQDLSRHPDTCVTIETGPNQGDCTTAAGRYQFLTTTWHHKAQIYHDHPPGWYAFWQDYNFSPEHQDRVVYRWLKDPQAWGVDIAQLLRDGQIEAVLALLSGTWTSLGYGIETNSMSAYLPEIYQAMLAEELAAAE